MAYDAFPSRWNDGDKQAAYDKLQGIANRAHDNYNAERRVTAELRAELDELRARAQRLEATLVLTEDQRDAARKELAALQKEHRRQSSAYLDRTVEAWRVINERDAAIAERDVVRTELAQLKSDLLAGG